MEKNEIYTNAIMTYAFTHDGKMIVRKNEEGKIDTIPVLFLGYREKKSRMNYEDSIWIMNTIEEYKERIATFFAYHLKNSRNAILGGYFTGNGNYLLDVGTLNEKIANHQIAEMKKMHTPSFIRINQESYEGRTYFNGQKIINNVEIRYIVFPEEDINNFPELEAKTLEELKEDFRNLSDKIILGMTEKNGELMEFFINQLRNFEKEISPKK